MAKVTRGAPKVFVVPELVANGPLEPGALLEEHLQAARARQSDSVRERLEAYLRDPGVSRKPLAQDWPNASALARMSSVERQRWLTWDAQHWLDAGLKKLLQGKAPREVFRLDAKRSARHTVAARDRNICAEVLRLIERCGYSRGEAIERVAEGFSVSVQVVERATGLWTWDAAGKREQRRFVPLWEQKLRLAGRLV